MFFQSYQIHSITFCCRLVLEQWLILFHSVLFHPKWNFVIFLSSTRTDFIDWLFDLICSVGAQYHTRKCRRLIFVSWNHEVPKHRSNSHSSKCFQMPYCCKTFETTWYELSGVSLQCPVSWDRDYFQSAFRFAKRETDSYHAVLILML